MRRITMTVALAAATLATPALAQRGGPDRPERNRPSFEQLDTNSDGVVDRAEFEAARETARERRQARGERDGRDGRNGQHAGRRGRRGPSPEQRAELLERFDTDHSGDLSGTERDAAMDVKRAEILQRFDADGNGELDQPERQAARAEMGDRPRGRRGHAQHGRRGGQMRERMIERFDADGNGELDEAERNTAREAGRERRQQIIEQFDANGDQRLDREERRAAREAMRAKKQRERGVLKFDRNGDGTIDDSEIAEAMSEISRGGDHADINRDGATDRQDMTDFLDRALSPNL